MMLRLLREQLYGVSPLDPLSTVVAMATVGVVGLAAGVIPAVCAIRHDPASVLRVE